jgi:hypothetical protein
MNANEKELQNKMGLFLSQYFFVNYEVWSTNHVKRIDLIIVHKSDADKKYPIGIEIKIDEKKKGKELANWIKQASTYSKLNFNGFGRCLIVTYPQISGTYLNEGTEMNQHIDEFGVARKDHNISTFLSSFGIGEMQRYVYENYKNKTKKEYIRIVYLGQVIWDLKDNELRTTNYERLCK